MIDPPTPSTIVEHVPRWLGRRPMTGETILVGFTDADPDHIVCLALQPDRDPVDDVSAMRQLVVDSAEHVAIVQTTGHEDPTTEHLREALYRWLAAAAERYGLEVLGVLVLVPEQRDTAGYFRSLPDPTRIPLPTPTEETS